MVDNRRYTMRDIGGLDNRLKKLEYYTALSLAENQTATTQIFDTATNTPYYKNGFVVDSFTGSATGNVTHPDYRAAIDRTNGTARPMFYEDNVKLVLNTGSGVSTNVRRTGSLLTLDYYEADYIKMHPGGTANLDMITNGLESPVYGSGPAVGKLIGALVSGNAYSYKDLLLKGPQYTEVGQDALRVVDGSSEFDALWLRDLPQQVPGPVESEIAKAQAKLAQLSGNK